MAYDPGILDAALSSAVGDDARLISELRSAFLDSAQVHVAQMRRARTALDWRIAVLRLQGLAASFGAVRLMECAAVALDGRVGDGAMLAAIEDAIATFVA